MDIRNLLFLNLFFTTTREVFAAEGNAKESLGSGPGVSLKNMRITNTGSGQRIVNNKQLKPGHCTLLHLTWWLTNHYHCYAGRRKEIIQLSSFCLNKSECWAYTNSFLSIDFFHWAFSPSVLGKYFSSHVWCITSEAMDLLDFGLSPRCGAL